jgi:hypothetical protein
VTTDSKTIAIDFDDTFTADPELWSQFIAHAQDRGHRVLCVTARRDTDENRDDMTSCFILYGVDVPIIFCNLSSKLHTMERRGTKVDIWIDDSPYAIVNGY